MFGDEGCVVFAMGAVANAFDVGKQKMNDFATSDGVLILSTLSAGYIQSFSLLSREYVSKYFSSHFSRLNKNSYQVSRKFACDSTKKFEQLCYLSLNLKAVLPDPINLNIIVVVGLAFISFQLKLHQQSRMLPIERKPTTPDFDKVKES